MGTCVPAKASQNHNPQYPNELDNLMNSLKADESNGKLHDNIGKLFFHYVRIF
jgi:hypothetical protein